MAVVDNEKITWYCQSGPDMASKLGPIIAKAWPQLPHWLAKNVDIIAPLHNLYKKSWAMKQKLKFKLEHFQVRN